METISDLTGKKAGFLSRFMTPVTADRAISPVGEKPSRCSRKCMKFTTHDSDRQPPANMVYYAKRLEMVASWGAILDHDNNSRL